MSDFPKKEVTKHFGVEAIIYILLIGSKIGEGRSGRRRSRYPGTETVRNDYTDYGQWG